MNLFNNPNPEGSKADSTSLWAAGHPPSTQIVQPCFSGFPIVHRPIYLEPAMPVYRPFLQPSMNSVDPALVAQLLAALGQAAALEEQERKRVFNQNFLASVNFPQVLPGDRYASAPVEVARTTAIATPQQHLPWTERSSQQSLLPSTPLLAKTAPLRSMYPSCHLFSVPCCLVCWHYNLLTLYLYY